MARMLRDRHLQHLHVSLVELPQAPVLHDEHQGAERLRLPWQPGQHERRQEVHALAVVDLRVERCIRLQDIQKSALAVYR